MIHEVLEGEGRWDLQLRPDTPLSVTDRISVADHGWGQIIVTPCRVNIDTIGTQQLNDVCIYSGLLNRRQARTDRLSGPGLWAALGRSDGVGPLVGAGLSATRSLRTWVQNLDLDPFITADSSLDNAVTYTWTSDRVMTYREAIESIMDLIWAGLVQLFIDPRTMTIKEGPQSWRQQRVIAAGGSWSSPLLTPDAQGREIGIDTPLIRCRFAPTDSNEEWLSDVTVTDATTTGTANGSVAYTYPGGVDVNMTKYVNDGAIPGGTGATTAGAAELGANNTAGREIVVYTDDPNILDAIVPGITVDCWDPLNGIYDTTVPGSMYRGQHIHPLNVVVVSVRAPIREGNGVYYLRYDSGDDAVDLSEWFIPETGDAQIELGRHAVKPLRNVLRRAGARRQ